MPLLPPLLRRFRDDEHGVYAIETVLVLPIIIWAILAMLTFVDAFRMQTQNLRGTYTVADTLSRRWDPVDDDFIEGLARIYAFQVGDENPTSMRVTVLYYDEPTDTHRLVWSTSNDMLDPALSQGDIDGMHDAIPTLANGDSIIIVDTWMDYTPPFDTAVPPIKTALDRMRFGNRLFVSPRFTPQLRWEGPLGIGTGPMNDGRDLLTLTVATE